METVRIALDARSYPVHIGAGAIDAEALYRPHLRRGRIAIVTNPVVGPLYLARVQAALARLHELYAVRDPLYREIADVVVDTGRQSAQTLARRLLAQLKEEWKLSA